MPFRRFFAAHGAKHPVGYSYAVLIAGILACMMISVVISVRASNRATEAVRREVQASLEREHATREAGRAASCFLINSQIAALREVPPPTAAGRNVLQAWEMASRAFGCPQPERK